MVILTKEIGEQIASHIRLSTYRLILDKTNDPFGPRTRHCDFCGKEADGYIPNVKIIHKKNCSGQAMLRELP
jgi:hypothetical protein